MGLVLGVLFAVFAMVIFTIAGGMKDMKQHDSSYMQVVGIISIIGGVAALIFMIAMFIMT